MTFPTISELQEVVTELNSLQSLIEHKGWKFFCSLIQSQQDNDVLAFFASPTASLDAALDENYRKGMIYATMSMIQRVDTRIEVLEEEALRLRTYLEEEQQNGRTE